MRAYRRNALAEAAADLHAGFQNWTVEQLPDVLGIETLVLDAGPPPFVQPILFDGAGLVALPSKVAASPLGVVALAEGCAEIWFARRGMVATPLVSRIGAAYLAIPSPLIAAVQACTLWPADVAEQIRVPVELVYWRLALEASPRDSEDYGRYRGWIDDRLGCLMGTCPRHIPRDQPFWHRDSPEVGQHLTRY